MAKKNVRSRAANSSADDLESVSPETELNMDLTSKKRTRPRRPPTEQTGDSWPTPEDLVIDKPAALSSRRSKDEAPSDLPVLEKGSRQRSRESARDRDPESVEEGTKATKQTSRLVDRDEPNFGSFDDTAVHANGTHFSNSDSNRTSDQNRPGQRGVRNESGNDNRDSRRRSRRRRGGGGGNSSGGSNTGSSNTGGSNTGSSNTGGPNYGGSNTGSANYGGSNTGSSNYGSTSSSGSNSGRGNQQGSGRGSPYNSGRPPQSESQRGSGGSRRSRRNRGGGSQNQERGFNQDRNFAQDRNRNQNQNQNQNRHPEPVELDDTELFEGSGMLEVHPNGYGFLRHPENNYAREKTDPFVPGTMIEKFALRPGVMLRGMIQPGRRQQGPRLRELFDVDGIAPDEYVNVKNFDELTPINPVYWYRLECGPTPVTTRVMDLLTPLGKGQRALIVAPPRSGKTVMLQHIANGIATNHPKTKLIVLLIDERPEEVTDMKRNVRGEVIASSLDEDIESHVRLSQIVIARCKRLAEMGQDVFLLMDSITRLARAFNKWVGNTGRTMSGGVDIKAMDIPKKLFSSARAFEEGGSLTIVGTALVDTGSRMDELIFQEFKGTGNMEMVLDRKLADRRVWPAIDISQSGTRREELLLHPDTLNAVTMLRRTLTSMSHIEAMEQLTKQLSRFKTNQEFINLISGKMGEL